MEKKIQFLGEDLTIRFNMAVELAYEEIAGKPFNLKELDSQRNSIALYMAAIIANNPDTKLTFERVITEASAADIGNIATAVIECMTDWLNVPAVIPEEKAKDGEEQPKN